MDQQKASKTASEVSDLIEGEDTSAGLFTTEEYLARYTRCAACGSHLHFTHLTNFIRNLTEETARCPECGLRARRGTHRLQ